jgi:sensor domain CHASE-containing protein
MALRRADKFWGIVSAVIDVDLLYADSGLTGRKTCPSTSRLREKMAPGTRDRPFSAHAALFDKDPVSA